MTRAAAWLIAAVLHVVLPLGAAVRYAFVEPELPPEFFRGDIFLIPAIESFNPVSLAQGATESEVDLLFGAPLGQKAYGVRDSCVRYQYSPHLSYMLLFRHGTVETIWLTEDASVPHPCEGMVARTVEVAPRPWYPSEVPRDTEERGCAWMGLWTCAAPLRRLTTR